MTTDLDSLREQACKIRAMADQAEATLALDAFLGLPQHQQSFVRAAANLARAGAAALDEAIELHRQALADLGYHVPPPRPGLTVVHSGGPDAAA